MRGKDDPPIVPSLSVARTHALHSYNTRAYVSLARDGGANGQTRARRDLLVPAAEIIEPRARRGHVNPCRADDDDDGGGSGKPDTRTAAWRTRPRCCSAPPPLPPPGSAKDARRREYRPRCPGSCTSCTIYALYCAYAVAPVTRADIWWWWWLRLAICTCIIYYGRRRRAIGSADKFVYVTG